MTFALYDAAAPVFVRGLNVLDGLIDKAVASGLDEAGLMEARLAPDMKPFPDQIRMATFSARAAVARLTGTDIPFMEDDETSLAQLKDRIARSRAFVQSIEPAAFAGAETRPVTMKFPGHVLEFEGAGYLTSFAIPNFYFHVTTAYAILRKEGVALGKQDFLGQLALV
ncbi:DUF1993 family protein [Brevundimonas sp.]|jgi:uncharacterized protein|uniref:DUF1993 domain-containing protein n=1 Tax=Brevundimonas sp. TaxID=1871086 RepID=UPI001791B556|nr:DUF1993 domain-containing protein [Brevundimonas sp.]MBA4808561.1 DUF1993 domain-containing protein [Brevundimonas sp.]